jgi:hypothetical protein
MRTWLRILGTGIGIGSVLLVTSAHGRLFQERATVTIELRDEPVSALLSAVSRELRRPVMADGHFGDRRVTIAATGSRADVLATISRALDVDIRDGKRGAILLVKRFSMESDVPQTRVEQINAHAANVLKVLPPTRDLDGLYDWTREVRELGRSLSPAQVESLTRGDLIRWDDIPPAQHDLLASGTNARVYGPPRLAWKAIRLISQLPESTLLRCDPNTKNLYIERPDGLAKDRMFLGVRLMENR